MSWLDNEYNRTQVADGWLETETDRRTSFQRAFLNQPAHVDEIPPGLRRDANNRAPFMDRPATNPPATPPCWVPPWAANS